MVPRTDLGMEAKNKVCASTETALKGSVMLSVHPHMAFGLQTIPSALPFAFPIGSALEAPAQLRGALGSGVCPANVEAGGQPKQTPIPDTFIRSKPHCNSTREHAETP